MITCNEWLVEKEEFDFMALVGHFVRKRKLASFGGKLSRLYIDQVKLKLSKDSENKDSVEKKLEILKNQIADTEGAMKDVLDDAKFMKDSLSSSNKQYRYTARMNAYKFHLSQLDTPEEKKAVSDKLDDVKVKMIDAKKEVEAKENEREDKLEDAKKKSAEVKD